MSGAVALGAPGGRDRRWPLPPFRTGATREAAGLVAAGELRRVVLDVHAAATLRDTFTLRLAALTLVLPQRLVAAGGVVCAQTAVWLYAGGRPPPRIDVALAPPAPRSATGHVAVHAVAYVAADLWPALPATAVTSPARTAADAARGRPHGEAVCVLAALGVTTGVLPEHVAAVLARLPGRPGVARARAAVAAWEGLCRPRASRP